MSQTLSIGHQQTGIYNALVPPEGPKSVAVTLDFSASVSYTIDFTIAYMNKTMTVVQTLWLDNSLNPDTVSVTVPSTGHSFAVPANSVGAFPIVAAIRPKIILASSGGVVVKCLFLNVPLPAIVWETAGGGAATNVSIVNIPAVTVNGVVSVAVTGTVATTAPAFTPLAPAAFAVVTGGTAVIAFAANTIVHGAVVKNPTSATETLYIDVVNTAQTSDPGTHGTCMGIAPGQTFPISGNLTTAVSVNAATAGHAFAAWSY